MIKNLKLIKINEVAKRLSISRKSVYRLIEKKKLKAYTIPEKLFRVAEKDLNQFIKKHKTK